MDNILSIARNARKAGSKVIYVSSVLERWGYKYRNIIKLVNNLLEFSCNKENFIFLDHSDITCQHISNHGLHPNGYGHVILKMNILKCFFSFNPFLCNFEGFYERALFEMNPCLSIIIMAVKIFL